MYPGGTDPLGTREPESVVLDTCVLLNFIVVGRTELLGQLDLNFLVPQDVMEEVIKPKEAAILSKALFRRSVTLTQFEDDREQELSDDLYRNTKMNLGESSAAAIAMCRNVFLATDDGDAKKECLMRGLDRIVSTPDLMVRCIRENLIDVQDADRIKKAWQEQHSFTLKFSSFAELVEE